MNFGISLRDENSNGRPRLPNLPERIRGLERLCLNLWWSWQPNAREMFRSLDHQAWRESNHNPLRMLALLPQETLQDAASDPEFVNIYDSVMEKFEASIESETGWFTAEYGKPQTTMAYFSAEYAFHNSLKLYAGGLGVLAGDYIKECSDLAIPVVAVGLIYSHGYLSQQLRDDGWQEDGQKVLDRTYDPVTQIFDQANRPLIVQVPLFDPPLRVQVWRADIGRVPVYLLDTDVEGNQDSDRSITHRLYTNDPEQRLRQELVLGMGGIRVLEALGVTPTAVHINEGHPAFALIERVRMLVETRKTFDQAMAEVRDTSVFTTHTPVPAGTDVFPYPLMDKYFANSYDKLGMNREGFLSLGSNPVDPNAGFNMTVFSLRMAKFCNAVSQKHGEVARNMWAPLWPDKNEADVPITAITNGVHLRTWLDPIWLQPMLDKFLGPNWTREQDQAKTWQAIDKVPNKELWRLRKRLKALLIEDIDERAREEWVSKRVRAESVIAFGTLLDPQILTIGFARRFTGYKRPDLILHDLDRLKRILLHPLQPVQIIFAGKAHPSDIGGQQLIQRIFQLAQDPDFAGRIAFVENYDYHLAQRMVRGVDVWLNNPLPPLEASGTSGMKAGGNGVPSLSVLDGWWIEGSNGENGWAFGGDPVKGDRTNADADALYRLIEEKIVPLYYRRADDEIPHDYVRIMKAAIKSIAPQFSTMRMVKEYVNRFYADALGLKESLASIDK